MLSPLPALSRAHPNASPRHSFAPQADGKFADYAPKTAFFFPGQGAQKVGMAKVRLPQQLQLPPDGT